MKLLVTLVLVLWWSNVSFAQSPINTKKLTATHGTFHHSYSSKKKHVIHYLRNGTLFRVKGFVTTIGTDSIFVYDPRLPNRIAITEIQKIKTPHPGFRILVGAVMGAGFVGMASNVSMTGRHQSDASSNAFEAGFGAVMIGAMVLPLSFVTDKASERRTKGGWVFAIE